MTNDKTVSPDGNWIRMVFKGNKVWAEKGSDNNLMVKEGRVRIKYNLAHDQEYLVNPSNLSVISDIESKTALSANGSGAAKKKTAKQAAKKEITLSGQVVSSDEASEMADEEQTITVYTDGASSGNPGPSGIGVYFSYGKHEKEISEYIGETTNNVAELEAIRRALLEIKKRDIPLRIYSDSSYAIGLLSLGWKASKNQELVEEIRNLLIRFKRVTFVKVEGHSGIPGNERADKLATGAIRRHLAG